MVIALLPVVAWSNEAISVTINDRPVAFADQGPVIVDGRTLVPVAGVFQALGFNTEWNSDIRQVAITRTGDVIIIVIDNNTFTTNGITHTLDVPAQIIGGRTMLPLAPVLQSVGYNVGWNAGTRTVLVSTALVPVQEAAISVTAPTPAPVPERVPEPASPPTPAPVAGVDMSRNVWLSATGVRYHSVNNCGNMNPARASSVTRQVARDRGHSACARCW